jgi:hypothetical protein
MRSPSIDFFYAQIDSAVTLTESYTEIEGLAFIIKACRLKPYDYVFGKKSNNLTLHRWWFDEFGNSLKIIKPYRVKIINNDLHLDRKRIVCTDLYHNLDLNKVIKMSKLVYIAFGKDEDLYQDCCLLSFLGLDNYLRSYLYLYGEWQQVSPLLMGMGHLKFLATHADIKHHLKLGPKEGTPLPCASGQAWLSSLPASSDLLATWNKECEALQTIFRKAK